MMERNLMIFRGALAAIALCACAPGAALAQSARQIEGGFEITFIGVKGFRLDFTARLDGDHYDVENHTYKEGVLKAISINYAVRNRAWGRFSPHGGARPVGGSLSLVVGSEPRSWLVQYAPDGTLQETNSPPWTPPPQKAIPVDKKQGSLDPLSAAIAVAMSGDQACNRTAPSNDGKRRVDVILNKVGTEQAAASDIPGTQGDLLVCDAYTKRIAGEFYDEKPEETESERERPMRLWMARMDETPFRYPVKLEAKTGFGTIRGRMVFFRERPLTDQERVAMQR